MNRRPPNFKFGALTTQPRCLLSAHPRRALEWRELISRLVLVIFSTTSRSRNHEFHECLSLLFSVIQLFISASNCTIAQLQGLSTSTQFLPQQWIFIADKSILREAISYYSEGRKMNLNCRRSIFIECKGYTNELDTSDSFLPMVDFNL